MVKFSLEWLDDRIADAAPLNVALGALAATLVGYALLSTTSKPAHEKFAKAHGLKNVKAARRLPGSHWLFGDASELGKNATRFPDWVYEKVVEMGEEPHLRRVPFLPDAIIISDPAVVEDVLKTQNDVFGKGEQVGILFKDLIGRAFPMQDGETWFHQRKTASKFFSARMYREVATKMINKHSEKLSSFLSAAADADHKPQVNLSRLFHEFTLQTFAELGFGLEMDLIGNPDGHPLDKALDEGFPQVLYRLQTPQWFWKLQRFLNIGSERRYAEVTGYIRSLVADMVQKSIAQTAAKGTREEAATMVELFIHAAQDGETGITPEIMCDVAISFAIAGRDTTADTLNWMFLMLSRHPEVEQKMREELWNTVPELMRGEIKTLSMEQTQNLVYMEAVVKETLRLYPPVPISQREASRDAVLVDGTFVPKGTAVSIPPFAMGRLTSIWGEDALEFKPERFIDAETGKPRTVSSFQFTSFHAGPRICIGMNLAQLEIKLLMAILLSRFHLDIAPNDGSYKFSASLPLKNPLMARVRHSKAASH